MALVVVNHCVPFVTSIMIFLWRFLCLVYYVPLNSPFSWGCIGSQFPSCGYVFSLESSHIRHSAPGLFCTNMILSMLFFLWYFPFYLSTKHSFKHYPYCFSIEDPSSPIYTPNIIHNSYVVGTICLQLLIGDSKNKIITSSLY